MCTCIQETEKQTEKFLKEKNHPKQVSGAEMQEVGFSMYGVVTYNTIKYNLSGKNKLINIYHLYCPFCGKKYPKLK